MKQEIECPHCKTSFPIPRRRHYFSATRGRRGGSYCAYPGTLCGLDHKNMELVAKDGETVNCKICLKRRAKGKA